jgi:hypothetical protein
MRERTNPMLAANPTRCSGLANPSRAAFRRVIVSDIEGFPKWEDQTEVNIRCAARLAQGASLARNLFQPVASLLAEDDLEADSVHGD